MFGLSFLNSLFLFGLTAAALPIIIHIFNRRRMRKVEFSSLEFILESSRRRMSKVNLRRWLVLLLRTLAVLFVVLAFARPAIRSGLAMFIPGDVPKYVVICLDTSGSMGAELETGTAFTTAQSIVGDVLDQGGKSDLLNVVTFSSRAEVLFDTGTRNKQIVKNVVGDLQVTAEGTVTSNAIEMAKELIEQSEFTTGEIYVISDFCETGDSLAVPELDSDVRVVLLPVADEAVDNVSIDRVFTPRKLIRPGEVVRVGVAVTNHSRYQPANFPLELFVGESRKAEKVVNLAPASSANVQFSVSMNDWGTYECRVSKNRDRLPTDDERFFLLDVSKKIPVTLIRGRRNVGADDQQVGSYFYVDKALNPRGSGEGEFSVTTIDEKDVTIAALKNRGVVVWTDPFAMDSRRLDILQRYVTDGGTMMVFLGADRRGLWRDEEFAQYVGMVRGTVKERGEGERFVSYQQDHPALALFNEEELELLSRATVRNFVSAGGVAPDSVLAYFGGGDPAMWECRRGQGRILVMASSPDMLSGDLPLSPMFLPLIHTTVSYLASTEVSGVHRENYVGSDLFFDLPTPFAHGGSLHTTSTGGERRKAVVYDSPQGETKAMVARPSAIGIYTLASDSLVVARAAVNMDTRESNLNPIVLDEQDIGTASVVSTEGDVAGNLERDRQGREVYAFFLLLAVGALVLESFLGRKA